MTYERLVFVFDTNGAIRGAAAYDFNGAATDLPTTVEQSTALSLLVQQGDLAKKLADAEDSIADLQRRLANYEVSDLSEVVKRLRAAGFYEWLAAAIAKFPDLIDEAGALQRAIEANNVEGFRRLYAKISRNNKPSERQLKRWQGVLDKANISVTLLQTSDRVKG